MSVETSPGDLVPRSSVEGIVWPRFVRGADAMVLGLLYQLERSQWAPPEALRAQQLAQAHALLSHCLETVPFYRDRLAAAGFRPDRPLTEAFWHALPLLSREEVLAAGAALHSRRIPTDHGRLTERSTSGSTGKPVKVRGTQLNAMFWNACTERDNLWQRRDYGGTFAVIRGRDRGASYPEGKRSPTWGAIVFASGPAALLRIDTPVEQQADWLARLDPAYLQTAPHNLRALLEHARATGFRLPGLRGVSSYGGMLHAEVREACRTVWGLPVADIYSAEEVGYLALQCPERGRLHVQAETVLLEILDENGRPCAPGEQGRVVATPLHNFAQPLIRYDLGDFAVAGEPCSCGRGLPVIERIVGRARNMLTLPDGRQVGPSFVNDLVADLPVAQFQIVQHEADRLEARLVRRDGYGAADEAQLLARLNERLPAAYRIAFRYVEEIPRTAGGKFMDFKSQIGR